MSDAEEFYQHLLKEHGANVGRDDPIMLLHTAHKKLLSDSEAAQSTLLRQFKEEIEALSFRLSEENKQRAERILTVSLSAAAEAMRETLANTAASAAKDWKAAIVPAMQEQRRQNALAKRLAWINAGIAGALVVSSALVALLGLH